MKVLYLAWQDPQSRQWFPVGKLSSDRGIYRFVYTKGAELSKNFMPFGFMQDLHAVYKSHDLLPLFANRLISKKRPEYRDFLRWLDLREDEADPLVVLARTEGVRGTGSISCQIRRINTMVARLRSEHTIRRRLWAIVQDTFRGIFSKF